MRISDRKRQLREIANNPDALAERRTLRAAEQSRPAARKTPRETRPESASKGKASTAPAPRARRQRGAGFYAGFGFFGLFFAILLGVMTVNTYRSDNDKYPTKVAQYHASQTAYPTKVAQYKQAVAKHVKPVSTAPVAPKAPSKPELNAGSMALPLLYGVLSLAYLYLAYRTKKARALLANAAPRAR